MASTLTCAINGAEDMSMNVSTECIPSPFLYSLLDAANNASSNQNLSSSSAQSTSTLVSSTSSVGSSTSSSRNIFSVSYANKSPAMCMDSNATHVYSDMLHQKDVMREHHQEQLRSFIHRHSTQTIISEKDARIAIKILLRSAATRDIALARGANYGEPVVDFMRNAWTAFVRNADQFLNSPSDNTRVEQDSSSRASSELNMTVGELSDEEQMTNLNEEHCMQAPEIPVSVTAIENISSIGVWFSGPCVSLPLRRYAVETTAEDGTRQNVAVVGIVSFLYSSYIMQLRAASQLRTLLEFQRVESQLGAPCLFSPSLLIAPDLAVSNSAPSCLCTE